ncbi:hypothetical protein KBZ10_10450 [Streptomyces sp. F63]|uniref:hypothetical protein n=1 Tax=Streptomyces sp. F63 TaxID=2824887 RepID=UPI001B36D32C|nr:hypothetical protein [Streptomyces sp. F63]MBQ0984929.1 hypothetical protein [Streptomyces sp. F63]
MASDDLDIQVAGSSSLVPDARQALEACVQRYGEDVLREAERIEASVHLGPGAPMVTSSMIQEADLVGRRGHIQPRVSKWKTSISVVPYIAAAMAGVFGENIGTPTGSIGFTASVLIGIFTFLAGRR